MSSLIDYRDIWSVEQECQQMKDKLLTQLISWVNVGAYTIDTDGSMLAGTDVTANIKGLIEPLRKGDQGTTKIPQGLAENSTHLLWTQKVHDINAEDTLSYNGLTFRVTYKVPPQFNIDYAEYLLKIDN